MTTGLGVHKGRGHVSLCWALLRGQSPADGSRGAVPAGGGSQGQDAGREPAGKTRPGIPTCRKLRHGKPGQNSTLLLAALLLPREGFQSNGQQEPAPLVHSRSAFRLPSKCQLKGNWHEASICSQRGLGELISLESFGNLALMGLHTYHPPAAQLTEPWGTLARLAAALDAGSHRRRLCRYRQAPASVL